MKSFSGNKPKRRILEARRAIIVFFALASVLFVSCRRHFISGTGTVVTEERDLTSFDQISIDAPVNAIIKLSGSPRPSMLLKGYKNLLDNIETSVAANKLSITVKEGILINTDENIYLEITTPHLQSLDVRSSADTELESLSGNGTFTINVTGAGDLFINNLNTQKLEATVSGAGTLMINNGLADRAIYTVAGAGNVKAYGLVCKDVKAKVSGAGDIKVHAVETLDVSVTGAGNMSYKGHPVIQSSTSGAGILRNAN